MIPTKHRIQPVTSGLKRLLPISVPAVLLVSLSGCTELSRFMARPEGPAATPEPQVAAEPQPAPIPKPQENKPKRGQLYEWHGDGRQVTHIVVDTNEQKARFYDGDEQIGWTTIASGVRKHPTPVGEFEVLEKVKNKKSNLYGKIISSGGKVINASAKAGVHAIPAGGRFQGATMPYFLRLTYDGVGLHAGPIPHPGRPASHGCIRMPRKMAPILFQHVDTGTRVSVIGKGPDYGNYAAKQRAWAAERAAAAEQERETQQALALTEGLETATPTAAPPPSATPTRVERRPIVRSRQPVTHRERTAPAGTAAKAPAPERPAIEAAAEPATAMSQATAAPPPAISEITTSRPEAPAAETIAKVTETTSADTPTPAEATPSLTPAPAAPIPPQPTALPAPMPEPYPPMAPARAYQPPPMVPFAPMPTPQAAPPPPVSTASPVPEAPARQGTDGVN